MKSTPRKTCTRGGAKLLDANQRGQCDRCAPRRTRSQRAQEAEYKKLLQAYAQSGTWAQARFRSFLKDLGWFADKTLALRRGKAIIARLTTTLPPEEIEHLRYEQYIANPPAIGVETCQGLTRVEFLDDPGQIHTTDQMKRQFETAIHHCHPDIQINWLPAPPPPRILGNRSRHHISDLATS